MVKKGGLMPQIVECLNNKEQKNMTFLTDTLGTKQSQLGYICIAFE